MSSTGNTLEAPGRASALDDLAATAEGESATIRRDRLTRDALAAFHGPLDNAGAHPVDQTLQRERAFRLLSYLWRQETAPYSSPARRAQHWAYQLIIKLGQDVVPFILREMQSTPDLWFIALREITGENPVAPADRGHVDKMTAAWIDWGVGKGLIS